MDVLEAKILIKNLLKRIRHKDVDEYELSGNLTDDEVAALKVALDNLNTSDSDSNPTSAPVSPVLEDSQNFRDLSRESASDQAMTSHGGLQEHSVVDGDDEESLFIDTSVIDLPSPPSDRRLCLDFGTAMSKVTLVRDQTTERGYEDIEVLKLGIPGDQEEVSETMLVSSVFIDGEGVLWFGQMAVQRSQLEAHNGERQRLDNIKRYLSEEGLGSLVPKKFNPTDLNITYADMILAYLMFLTWAVNHCLGDAGEPRNLNRRFAMPCFDASKARAASRTLKEMLGEAQALADTFIDTLPNGIPLVDFLGTVNRLRALNPKFGFVDEDITEPLGVAGAIMSWEEDVNSLVMVIDVGAGTSDFSLYRLHYNAETGKSMALEVKDSSEGFTEAGNHLDNLLSMLIVREAGIDSSHPHWVNILGNLSLGLRDYKERLFVDGDVSVPLFNDQIVDITRDQFLELPQVVKFGESLRECRDRILRRVDGSFIQGAPNGVLGLALTGGGMSLPMVKELAAGTVTIGGTELKLIQTKEFPQWLADEFPELENDYPRVAVSLGGARKRIISKGGVANITAGDIKAPTKLRGYYT